jgi:hypothetical protein
MPFSWTAREPDRQLLDEGRREECAPPLASEGAKQRTNEPLVCVSAGQGPIVVGVSDGT